MAEEKIEKGPKGWEARYWDLFDHARDLIHIYDPEGRFIAVNKRWIEVLGYTKEEALQMTLPDIVHPDLLAACLATFVNFDKGISYTAFESMFVAKDGHTVYVTGNMVPYLEQGKLVRTRHIFTDVSFSKQAEAVLKGLGEGLIVTDKLRTITLSNKAAEKMLGKKSKELLGQKWPNVLGAKGIVDEEGKQVLISKLPFYTALTKSEKSFSSDYQYAGKEGKMFPVTIAAAPVILAGEITGVVEVFRDITEEKAAERLKNDFLNNTTHELKTPLIPIKSQSQLLLAEDYGKLNTKQKESIEMILKNETHLEGLVTDVMEISELHSKKMTFDLKPSDLKPLLENTVKDMQELAKEKGITLTLKSIPALPKLSLDEKRITQVIHNLLNNALKFTPEGGSVTVEITQNEKEVTTTVKDTGIGISPDTLKKLFTPFFQAESDEARKYPGTGLGLSIAKGFIEAHGGKIAAESGGEGKGSVFSFTLPVMRSK